jgi:hypothetical protein
MTTRAALAIFACFAIAAVFTLLVAMPPVAYALAGLLERLS